MIIMNFSFATFAKLCFLFIVFMCFVSPVYSGKKCTRTLKRIPVHKGFDLNKFAGTWFTVTRTKGVWGDYTFESFSLEIQKSDDGSFDFSYTGQLGDKCHPVESGKLVKNGRPGQYTLRIAGQTSDPATLIISFTDYKNLALVYYCFKYRPGSRAQCQKNGMQVEIISKDLNPNKKALNGYIKRSGKRLCAPAALLEATQPGLCKIPEIIAAAKQRAKDLKEADSMAIGNDQCAVNNIPLQKNFSSEQLKGLWYEIARTRFTFNKMESVVNYHRYDDATNQIYSYYTGTIINPELEDSSPYCMTAIQGMSKTVKGAESDSDRLGRIGWDDSSFQWSPTKVIYADDEYILFYACYSGETDEPCNKFAMEVTLSGRSRDISDEKRNSIYSILENCLNPSDMVETQFEANCSSWVTIQPEEVHPEDCKLDDIQVYDDYISSLMAGTWSLYSSITYDNMTSLNGVIMEKTLTSGIEGITTRLVAYSQDAESCTEYRSRSRDMCIDTADHISLLINGDGNFVFSKVLYLDEELLVEYVCSARTLDGKCDRHGIQFNVYSKNDTTDEDFILTDDQQDMINILAKSVCLDPDELQLQSVWCNMTNATANEKTNDRCDIDTITIFSDVNEYSQELIYGYWYEISRSSKSTYKPPVRSAVAYFTSPSNETLNVYYTGLTEIESDTGTVTTCSDVLHSSIIARCNSDINGDSMYRFHEGEKYVSYIPYKIIYTDYENVLVTYMCTDMLDHGECSETGEEIILWSRNKTLGEEVKEDTYEMAFWVCLQPKMVDSHQDNDACRSNLEEYVTENQIGVYDDFDSNDDYNDHDDDDDGNDDDDSDDDNGEQRDQGKNKYELSDIDALLLMDDDEFYYYS